MRRIQWKGVLAVVIMCLVLAACSDTSGPASPTPIPTNTTVNQANAQATDSPLTAIASPQPTTSPAGAAAWSLVVVGDSIPYNSPEDCPGCTGFVDRYVTAITKATGHFVKVQNLSQHNGLNTDGLLKELQSDAVRRDALANADIIIVSIGGNDIAWNINDDPCDGPTSDNPDWSKFNPTCAAAAAEIFRPKLESVYSQIAALRAGKATIFRTTDRYNDWIGWPGHDVPPEAISATHDLVDAWNAMVCKAAQANGFTCADIYHEFNGSDGITPAADLLAADYTHPSDKGNEVIAGVLAALGYVPTSTAANPSSAATMSAQATELPTAEASVPSSTAVMQFTGHTERVRNASFSPDGTYVVTAAGDGVPRIWDVVSGKELRQFKGHTNATDCAIFSPDGKTVLTTSWDQTVRLWDAATGKQLLLFTDNKDVVRKAVFSPDGKYVVNTTDDGTARVWDIQNQKTIVLFKGHAPGTHVNRVAFSPDGKTVATSGDDRTARIWEPRTGKELMVFRGHTDAVAGVAFSPDGKNLATASSDSSVRLWDVATGKELRRLANHTGGASGVAFSPDGKYVATSGFDDMARLWELQTGAEVRRFIGHTDAVRGVLFSPDGKYLLTSSDDDTARLWIVD
ncbi:MAG: GDSL-type esterase/lipase family protein [Chloroflexota bacterium]